MSWLKKALGGMKESPNKVVGVGSTQIHGGYINSREKSPQLQGTQKYVTYSNILANTAIVGASLRLFLNLLSKAEWKFDFEKDGSDVDEMKEKLEMIQCETETPWHRIVRRTAMYRFYGFGMQEWTAKLLDDGTIGYWDIQARPQFTIERWDIDPASGMANGIWQRSPQTGQEIYLPRQKLIYAIDDAISDSPEGLGLFRHIVEAARRLGAFEQMEGQGFETDLRGVPIGRAPLNVLAQQVTAGKITSVQKDAFEAGIRSFMENHVRGKSTSILLDSQTYMSSDESESPSGNKMWDVELMQGSSNSQDAVAKAIMRLNYEIAMVLGTEGMLAGYNGTGSLALSSDKTATLHSLVDGTLNDIAEVYNKDYINPLWDMNGWDDELKPKMKPSKIHYRDVSQLTAALRDLATAGAPLAPDDPAIDEIRDLVGLSHQPEGIAIDASLLDDGYVLGPDGKPRDPAVMEQPNMNMPKLNEAQDDAEAEPKGKKTARKRSSKKRK